MSGPPPSYRGLVSLLLRATLWMPVGLVIAALLLASAGATMLLPLIAFANIYAGDYPWAALQLVGTIPAFLLARVMFRYFFTERPR